MTLRVLYVDFNSYFASVEQQVNPQLRGKPVAVVPVMAETTCCIAASYEAKAFGVRTGTRVSEARRLCPDIRFIHGQHELYVDYHHKLVAAVDACAPVSSVRSIDEMAVELPTRWRSPEAARRVARQIKQRIREQVADSMTCSIGIAPNTFLAKTAADMQKPDGLTVLEQRDLPDALHRLQLRDLCGIGPRMEQRLRRAGIDTVAALCRKSAPELRKAWGSIGGELLHAQLRGVEIQTAESPQATLGHSHVLPPALRNDVDARAVAHRMLQKAAMRLRKNRLATAGLHLSIRFFGHDRWGRDAHFNATQDTGLLTQALDQLWSQPKPRGRPLAVGVTLVDLTPEMETTRSLFDDPAGNTPPRVLETVDRLNKQFGKNTLFFGAALRATGEAPMRIAFNRIPDIEVER